MLSPQTNAHKRETKTCSVCGDEFPLDHFYLRRDRGKRISRCKKCNGLASKKSWSKKTTEERRLIYREHGKWFEQQAQGGNLKAIIQHKLCSWKGNAKRKNVPFDLTTDFLINLWKGQKGRCYYTNKELNITSGQGRGDITLVSRPDQFSLDRLIPSLGYVRGNVVWCGWLINTMKNLMSEEQFYQVCEDILQHRKSNNECA